MDSPGDSTSARKSKSLNKSVKLLDKKKNYEKAKGFLLQGALHKYEGYVSNEEINLEVNSIISKNVVEYIRKENSERSEVEIYIISKYLESTDLISKINEEKSNESKTSSILYYCAFSINLVNLNKGKYLFREDEISENFYVILKGEVTLYRIKLEKRTLTYHEYFLKLIELQKNDHNNLVSKNIRLNQKIVPIKPKDYYLLKDIYFYFRYKYWLENKGKVAELEEFVRTGRLGLHTELNFIDLLDKEMSNDQDLYNQIDTIINMKAEQPFDVKYYSFLEQQESTNIVLLSYEPETVLDTGKVFGDNDFNNIRTYMIQGTENTILGELDESDYKDLVINEKKKNIIKEVLYLIDNFYFQSVKTSIFKKKYFKHFERIELNRGETLTREGEKVSYLYLIKEGEIEVKTNQSLLEINSLLKFLEEMSGKNISEKGGLKTDPINHLKDLQKKKLIRLFIYGAKEAIGLIEYIFKIPFFAQTTPLSDKVLFYRISIDVINKLCNEERSCYYTMQKVASIKLKSYVIRLIEIKNHFLTTIDNISQIRIEENRLKQNYENEELKKNHNSAFPIIKTEKYINNDSYQKQLNDLNKIRELSSISRGNSIENSRVSSPSINIKKNTSVLLKMEDNKLYSEERTLNVHPKKKSESNLSETKRRINYFEKAIFKNSITLEKSIQTVFPSSLNNFKIIKNPMKIVGSDHIDFYQKRILKGKLVRINESQKEMGRSKSLNNSDISKYNEEDEYRNHLIMDCEVKEREYKRPFYHQFILKSNKLKSKMINL